MGLDWLRYGKVKKRLELLWKSTDAQRQRKVETCKGEEMISNGKVARGQVKKSNGKVTTRLVWQGKRYDVKSNGKVQSR